MGLLKEMRFPFSIPIILRIMIFNLLVLFLPIGSLLLLETYELQLLEGLEHALVQQARLTSAALRGSEELESEALSLFTALAGRHEARLRVVDDEAYLLADTSQIESAQTAQTAGKSGSYSVRSTNLPEPGPEDSLLYRIASLPIRFYRAYLQPPRADLAAGEFYSDVDRLSGAEIAAALSGRYGAATRISSGGQNSVTLYSAIPIYGDGGDVIGAALASQSTYRILQNLYELRLDMGWILFYSLISALGMSIIASLTITRPLKSLGRAARAALDPTQRRLDEFPHQLRRDEIGTLARGLAEAGRRLNRHIDFMEEFAADVAHEIKNPLASIRSAAELALEMGSDPQQRFFIERILSESTRITETADGMRELSYLDARLEREPAEPLDPVLLLEEIAAEWRGKHPLKLTLPSAMGLLRIRGSRGRLRQAFFAILQNGDEFSPEGAAIEVALRPGTPLLQIEIRDRGPGIREEDREKIFQRFFSYRPGPERDGGHKGIGLSIARSIIEAHRGRVSALDPGENRTGALIRIELPLLGRSSALG